MNKLSKYEVNICSNNRQCVSVLINRDRTKHTNYHISYERSTCEITKLDFISFPFIMNNLSKYEVNIYSNNIQCLSDCIHRDKIKRTNYHISYERSACEITKLDFISSPFIMNKLSKYKVNIYSNNIQCLSVCINRDRTKRTNYHITANDLRAKKRDSTLYLSPLW